MKSPHVPSETTADELLREAVRIRDELNTLSTKLSKAAPGDEAFYATNRAWRSMTIAVENLRKLQ